MTLNQAFQKWLSVWGNKSRPKGCRSALRKFLLEPYGDMELKDVTDLSVGRIFERFRGSNVMKSRVAGILQQVLKWCTAEGEDPAFKGTEFQIKGLSATVPNTGADGDGKEEDLQSQFLDQIPESVIRFEGQFNGFCSILLDREGLWPFTPFDATRYVEICFMGRIYMGIGIRNRNNGMEYYCPELKDESITIHNYGILYIPLLPTERSHSCCLFTSFLDCIAYAVLLGRKAEGVVENCDFIVLNSPKNFKDMFVDSDLYENVYCLFPRTDFGVILWKTLKTRNSNVQDLSFLYKDHVSLTDMARKMKDAVSGTQTNNDE